MSSLPLKDGDKKREDVLDALNHTLQKWSYGKSPRWTFAERYIKGHISIHFKCTLRVPMETYPNKICVSFERGNIF